MKITTKCLFSFVGQKEAPKLKKKDFPFGKLLHAFPNEIKRAQEDLLLNPFWHGSDYSQWEKQLKNGGEIENRSIPLYLTPDLSIARAYAHGPNPILLKIMVFDQDRNIWGVNEDFHTDYVMNCKNVRIVRVYSINPNFQYPSMFKRMKKLIGEKFL